MMATAVFVGAGVGAVAGLVEAANESSPKSPSTVRLLEGGIAAMLGGGSMFMGASCVHGGDARTGALFVVAGVVLCASLVAAHAGTAAVMGRS